MTYLKERIQIVKLAKANIEPILVDVVRVGPQDYGIRADQTIVWRLRATPTLRTPRISLTSDATILHVIFIPDTLECQIYIDRPRVTPCMSGPTALPAHATHSLSLSLRSHCL